MKMTKIFQPKRYLRKIFQLLGGGGSYWLECRAATDLPSEAGAEHQLLWERTGRTRSVSVGLNRTDRVLP